MNTTNHAPEAAGDLPKDLIRAVSLAPGEEAPALALREALQGGGPARRALLAVLERRIAKGLQPDWWASWTGVLRALDLGEIAQAAQAARQARVDAISDTISAAHVQLTLGRSGPALALLAEFGQERAEDMALVRLRLAVHGLAEDEAAYFAALDDYIALSQEAPKRGDLLDLARMPDAARREAVIARLDTIWPDAGLGRFLSRHARQVQRRTATEPEPNEPLGAFLDRQMRAAPGTWAAREGGWIPAAAESQTREVVEPLHALGPLRPEDRPIVRLGDEDVTFSEAGPSDCLFLIFCTPNGRVGVEPEVIDICFARRGISTVYLRDPQMAAFALGVQSLGADHAATVLALRKLVAASGKTRVFTLGVSGGAGAAVQHALELGVEGSLLIAPLLTVRPEWRQEIKDRRGLIVTTRAYAAMGDAWDVRALYAAQKHRPRVHVYRDPTVQVDAAHAALIEGQEGVRMFDLQSGYGHAAVWQVVASGQFEAALDRLLAK